MTVINPDIEYQEISENLRTSVAFFWKGFTVFIAINALLLTGIGFTFGEFSDPEIPKTLFAFILGVFGLVTSILAVFAVNRLLDFARIFLDRGKELESSSTQMIMHKSDDVFWNSKRITAKTLSFFVFIYFGIFWFSILSFCIYTWIFS